MLLEPRGAVEVLEYRVLVARALVFLVSDAGALRGQTYVGVDERGGHRVVLEQVRRDDGVPVAREVVAQQLAHMSPASTGGAAQTHRAVGQTHSPLGKTPREPPPPELCPRETSLPTPLLRFPFCPWPAYL